MSAAMRRIAPGERGFTLVEMLVSLALLGLLGALLLAGVRMVGTVVARERGEVVARDDIVAAQRLLRHRIERQRAVIAANSAVPIVDARGTRADYLFIAPSLEAIGPAPLQRFRITRSAAGDLMLYAADTRNFRVDASGTDMAGWRPMVLLHGVADLAISYFGAAGGEGGARWQERWVDQPQPPTLVRISVAFPPGDRRRWPDLLVAPRATVNSACRIDALTGRCGGA